MNPPNSPTEIIPGILEQSFAAIEEKIESVKPFATTLHIDIIDGIFTNNKTFIDPQPFSKFASNFTLELHMMVQNPIEYIQPFAEAGFTRFLGHVEKMEDQQKFVDQAKKYGQAGLALDGPTPLDKITVPYQTIDTVLIYTSEKVGFSGPAFLPDRLKKVSELHAQVGIPIEVDGGINDQTITMAKDAGASRFAATSYLFKTGNTFENFKNLQSKIS